MRGLLATRLLRFALALGAAGPAIAQIPADLPGGGALPGETVVIPSLRGIVTVPDAGGAALRVPRGFSGLDVSRTPALDDPAARQVLAFFVGKPASIASLDRLAISVRSWLRLSGQPFVTAYVPPQDVTDGVVRLVVQPARLEGELEVQGAAHFGEQAYRDAVPAKPGAPIDARAVADGVERLNQNPFRSVTVIARPGDQPGTTRLALRVRDERPWRYTLGYSNTGTRATDEDRLSFSALWGDAFGRGDQMGYSFAADPRFERSLAHSAHYTTVFRSLSSLTVYGSYSEIEADLPAPIAQKGKSWQVGARYAMPLGHGAWRPTLALSGDFKYSDNNLEFAQIPVVDNVTHVVQAGARLSATRRTETGGAALGAALFVSPGGVTSRNSDAAFDVSRAGARARYAYVRLDARHEALLPGGFSTSVAATVQLAERPLLGTEQLNGGGAAGVRGYREASAFGDEGVVLNAELHFPGFAFDSDQARGDPFVFLDAASLREHPPFARSLRPASIGAGFNVQIGRGFSLSFAAGRQLEGLPANNGRRATHAHVNASLSF